MKQLSVNAQVVLVAIWRLKDEAYGVRIRDEIKQMTGRTFTFGTLYNTLDALARKEYVISKAVRVLNQAGGNKRVYYTITEPGLEAMRRARDLYEAIWKKSYKYSF